MAPIYCSVDKVNSLEKTPNAVCDLWWEVFAFGIEGINKMTKIGITAQFILCMAIWYPSWPAL